MDIHFQPVRKMLSLLNRIENFMYGWSWEGLNDLLQLSSITKCYQLGASILFNNIELDDFGAMEEH